MFAAHEIYADLLRGTPLPSSVLAMARESAERGVVRWQADPREPSDALAVVGALVLSAAVKQPMSWDGSWLRGGDPVALIVDARLTSLSVKGDARVAVTVRRDLALTTCEPVACRYWAGRISREMIWESCQEALRGRIFAARMTPPDEDDRVELLSLGARVRSPICATGYDSAAVGIARRDGFSASAHGDRMALVGGRPGVEMYALLGALWLEDRGLWPLVSRPQIPDLSDVVLRDVLDLGRLCIRRDPLPVRHGISGMRSYLEAA